MYRPQFVQEGRLSPAYLIQRYTVVRHRAIIVALLIDLEARLIDAALDIADKGSLHESDFYVR